MRASACGSQPPPSSFSAARTDRSRVSGSIPSMPLQRVPRQVARGLAGMPRAARSDRGPPLRRSSRASPRAPARAERSRRPLRPLPRSARGSGRARRSLLEDPVRWRWRTRVRAARAGAGGTASRSRSIISARGHVRRDAFRADDHPLQQPLPTRSRLPRACCRAMLSQTMTSPLRQRCSSTFASA